MAVALYSSAHQYPILDCLMAQEIFHWCPSQGPNFHMLLSTCCWIREQTRLNGSSIWKLDFNAH